MGTKKSMPSVATAKGKLCPVCGTASYSLGGIHPQCLSFRADQKLFAGRKPDRAEAALLRRSP